MSGISWVNFVLLVIILLVIIIFFIWVGSFRSDISKVINNIDKILNDITNGIKLSPKPNTIIDYGNNIPSQLPPAIPYDSNFTIFCARTCMSSVNNYLKAPLLLPPNLQLISSIGTYGILLKRLKDPGDITPGNLFIIAFRGTESNEDVKLDFTLSQIPWQDLNGKLYTNTLVHKGFYDAWATMNSQLSSILVKFTSNDSVAITGHSMGSALAYMTSLSFALQKPTLNQGVFTFAPPRPGNNVFLDMIQQNVALRYSVSNINDLIVSLPPAVTTTIGQVYYYDQLDSLVLIDVETTSLGNNHYIGTYVCGVSNSTAKECSVIQPIVWSNPTRIVTKV